jgi:NADP-dependent 3-hydroxy acid dehydrogenase YdfG
MLVVKLDVASPQDAEPAVNTAVDGFGAVDVLVNNAASVASKFALDGWMESLAPRGLGGWRPGT